MSIVACVKVYDGIVLGAESMTQLNMVVNGTPTHVKSYANAQKIFQVGNYPIGILTYGVGNIGRRSIESFVHEFSRGIAEELTVGEVAQQFFAFIKPHYDGVFGEVAHDNPQILGFIIAGYSTGGNFGTILEFVLPMAVGPTVAGDEGSVGALWKGIPAPFQRLVFGFDPALEKTLRDEGASDEEIARLKSVLPRFATQVAFDGMPLADATEYCRFIIQTTIGWCTFALGPAACGGPIKLATITPGAGFKWVVRPQSYLEGEKHAY